MRARLELASARANVGRQDASLLAVLDVASRCEGRTGWPNDDRVLVDEALGVFAVVDASGPTYGGHFKPLGIDEAWSALVKSFARSADHGQSLGRAMGAAHELLARLPCNTVKPWKERSHGWIGMAALSVRAGRAQIAHVGLGRAYLHREGRTTRLVTEHSLAEAMRAQGRAEAEIADAESFHRSVVTKLLGAPGGEAFDTWSGEARAGDVFLICTDGLWRAFSESALDEALSSPARDATDVLDRLFARPRERNDDASAVLLRIGAGEGC